MQTPNTQVRLLRIAFATGAVTDALAVLPMLFPALARILWGFTDQSGPYGFAMGYAASLMLGWTGLLAWAYRKPIERRFVAILTLFVICGLVVTELIAVLFGDMTVERMVPTWCLQAALLGLFGIGYCYPSLRRKEALY
jgi:hypothetical protein